MKKIFYPSVFKLSNPNFLRQKHIELCQISLLFSNYECVYEIAKALQVKYPHLHPIIMQDSFGDKKWIDIMCGGVYKSSSLKILAGKLNIPLKSIAVFGDGKNDIEMIKVAGMGVAMGNALEEVKEVVGEITLTNDEDGIGVWVDKNIN